MCACMNMHMLRCICAGKSKSAELIPFLKPYRLSLPAPRTIAAASKCNLSRFHLNLLKTMRHKVSVVRLEVPTSERPIGKDGMLEMGSCGPRI